MVQVTVVDNLVNSSPESLNRVAELAGPTAAGRLHFFEMDVGDQTSLRVLLAAMPRPAGEVARVDLRARLFPHAQEVLAARR